VVEVAVADTEEALRTTKKTGKQMMVER